MIPAREHEQQAHSSSMDGDTDTAMVYTVLALASAIEEAGNQLACELIEHRPDTPTRR